MKKKSVGSQSSKVKFADKNSKHWGWDGQKHVLFYFAPPQPKSLYKLIFGL